MRLSVVRKAGGIGMSFGNFTKSFGFYRISLAANEQKVWKGFAYGCWKATRHQLRDWWMIAVPATCYYLLYVWAKKEHEKFRRSKDH